MSGPLVSVVMNCYNSAKYLPEAIESVLRQSYLSWEIVFWDNCSTDDSPKIVRGYSDQRIRYLRAPDHTCLGAARNRSLKETHGDYLLFLDCDDILLESALEVFVQALEQSNCALAFGGAAHVNADGTLIRRLTPKARRGRLFGELLRHYEISLVSCMVRKDALDASGLNFDITLKGFEEYCLFMHLAAEYEICAINEILAKYRVHDGALTNKTIAHWGEENEFVLNALSARYPALKAEYAKEFEVAYAHAAYYRVCYYVSIKDRLSAIRTLKRYLLFDPRYLALFVLLFLPFSCWNYAHRRRSGRTIAALTSPGEGAAPN